MTDEAKAPKAAKAKKPAKKTVKKPAEAVAVAAAPVETTSQDLNRLTLETTKGPVVIKLRPDLGGVE